MEKKKVIKQERLPVDINVKIDNNSKVVAIIAGATIILVSFFMLIASLKKK